MHEAASPVDATVHVVNITQLVLRVRYNASSILHRWVEPVSSIEGSFMGILSSEAIPQSHVYPRFFQGGVDIHLHTAPSISKCLPI